MAEIKDSVLRLRLSQKMREQLREMCKKFGVNESEMVRRLIMDLIERNQPSRD